MESKGMVPIKYKSTRGDGTCLHELTGPYSRCLKSGRDSTNSQTTSLEDGTHRDVRISTLSPISTPKRLHP